MPSREDLESAQLLLKRGDAEGCERLCERLLRQGDDPDIQVVQALAQAHQGHARPALATLKSLITSVDDAPAYWRYALAVGYDLAGDPEQAIAVTETALDRYGPNSRLSLYRANLLLALGRYESAAAALDSADLAAADPPTHAHLLSVLWRRRGQPLDALNAIERGLACPEQTPPQRRALLFEQATVLDQLGRFDAAFAACAAANSLGRQPYDATLHKDAIDRTIRHWTADAFARAPNRSGGDTEPVLIVGMPRTGSTLLEQMLDCHPALTGNGEGDWLQQAMLRLDAYNIERYGTLVSPALLDAATLHEIAEHYARALPRTEGHGTRPIDKTLVNHQLVGAAAKVFADLRVLWCRRHPLDTILSCYFQGFNRNAPYADVMDIARQYHGSERLLTHWRDELGITIHTVQYEALVETPRETLGRALTHLGLPWHEGCLSFHRSVRRPRTASQHQINRPLYTSSIGRWHHYAKHLETARRYLAGLGHIIPETAP